MAAEYRCQSFLLFTHLSLDNGGYMCPPRVEFVKQDFVKMPSFHKDFCVLVICWLTKKYLSSRVVFETNNVLLYNFLYTDKFPASLTFDESKRWQFPKNFKI